MFLAFIVSVLLALGQTAPPAQPFQRLDGCIYKAQRWNDGDSFHVILPDPKEIVFRLYFVDTPFCAACAANSSGNIKEGRTQNRAVLYDPYTTCLLDHKQSIAPVVR